LRANRYIKWESRAPGGIPKRAVENPAFGLFHGTPFPVSALLFLLRDLGTANAP